jgi:hypothetical protein
LPLILHGTLFLLFVAVGRKGPQEEISAHTGSPPIFLSYNIAYKFSYGPRLSHHIKEMLNPIILSFENSRSSHDSSETMKRSRYKKRFIRESHWAFYYSKGNVT